MSSTPRVLVVSRPTDYEELLSRHGTREQARFFLAQRGQSIDDVDTQHQRFQAALASVAKAIPVRWRRTKLRRQELSRFVFEPEDIIVAIGQDGLVPNVAKYLSGQRVIGINPDPSRYDGILVKHRVESLGDLLNETVLGRRAIESRTMVEARLDDGQRILALNEIFIGHRTHQSARYRIACGKSAERHSSSGLIIATGTGSTGWAKSISRDRRKQVKLPNPSESALSFFVREAFPSVASKTTITEGRLNQNERLCLTSEMNDDGVVFGDGIEDDRLSFVWGVRADVGIAPEKLMLILPHQLDHHEGDYLAPT